MSAILNYASSGDSQGARVLLGECGQEDVGEVDEQRSDGLLGRVKEPGKHGTRWERTFL